tara:strand:- start:567 stop:800 length:234 start_codon:yes stop_codon:yes gene_type:complete
MFLEAVFVFVLIIVLYSYEAHLDKLIVAEARWQLTNATTESDTTDSDDDDGSPNHVIAKLHRQVMSPRPRVLNFDSE